MHWQAKDPASCYSHLLGVALSITGLVTLIGRLLGVMAGVGVMAVRQVSVMRGLLVRTGLVVLGPFLMMTCSMLMMLGGLLVMLRSLLRHRSLPPVPEPFLLRLRDHTVTRW